MSGFTFDTNYVYGLVSSLRENGSLRYVSLETDVSMNQYYVTIYDTSMYPVAEGVKYVFSVAPIAALTPSLASQTVFYQVYVNPSTTELITTRIRNATPISFSISKSLVYLFYQNQSFGLQFRCPFTNINGCKQAILSIFSYPCYIVMLYGTFFLQFSYIQTAYEAVMCGSYTGSSMTIHNLFDYNNTFVVLEKGQPEVYWNTQRFSLANQVPYVSYSEGNTTLVVGFSNTYIIQQNTGNEPDLISMANASSLNIPSTNVSGIGYTSLASLVPLETTSTSDYIFYYLSGVAGIGFMGSMYATIQIMNILNSNNTYQSTSALIVPFVNATPGMLTQYESTSLWYNYDLMNMTLTVWVSTNPAVPSFAEYLTANKSTIMTSDMIQLTSAQIDQFYSGMVHGQRMGAITGTCKCNSGGSSSSSSSSGTSSSGSSSGNRNSQGMGDEVGSSSRGSSSTGSSSTGSSSKGSSSKGSSTSGTCNCSGGGSSSKSSGGSSGVSSTSSV